MTGPKFYPEDYTVEIQIPFTDLNGDAIVPTAISAELLTGDDEILETFDPVTFQPEDQSVTITVMSGYNRISEGQTREARILRVAVQTGSGVIHRTHSYIIESEQRLSIMTNTFQSYEAAEIAAMDLVAATGWEASDQDSRKTAMVEAFRKITSIPMTYTPLTENGHAMRDVFISREKWFEMTTVDWADIPMRMRKAVRLAQVIEASHLLEQNDIADRRKMGVIKETIGESSVTLTSPSSLIKNVICEEAMSVLNEYVKINMKVARA